MKTTRARFLVTCALTLSIIVMLVVTNVVQCSKAQETAQQYSKQEAEYTEKITELTGKLRESEAARKAVWEIVDTLTDEELPPVTEPAATSKTNRGGDVRLDLMDENRLLRETIAKISVAKGSEYVKSLPGTTPVDLDKYIFKRDLGTWSTTYYNPSKNQCGSTKGIGASGRTVVPGLSCAIDSRYWKMGTLFYVEGFGVVRADDTGSGIKGQHRMDICILNSEVANELGRMKQHVWLIEERK